MSDLQVAFIQADILWNQPFRNCERFQLMANEIRPHVDVLLFPEMFNTGFYPDPERFAEEEDGPSVEFLSGLSHKKDCLVMATLAIRENGKFYNRLYCIFPDGRRIGINKRHLFSMSGENKIFSSGNERVVISWREWNILPLVCYDLRFPVWSRNGYLEGRYEYDLLIYLSNWPKSRSRVWNTLLSARAMENQSYVIGVNRIGSDGQGTDHAGESMMVHPKGMAICKASVSGEPCIKTCLLSRNELDTFRKEFPLGPDWDHFNIQKE
ncbi:MAG: nitrilase-related carbon-nitrogen hydrolase [Bacteroidota bacterium]|nr:nitrilase-related carbon-nitrogen hydrolase [Bacteroidota bacterium]